MGKRIYPQYPKAIIAGKMWDALLTFLDKHEVSYQYWPPISPDKIIHVTGLISKKDFINHFIKTMEDEENG